MDGTKMVLRSLILAGIMIFVSSAPRKFEVFVASNRGISQPKLSYLVRQTAKPPAAYHTGDKVRSKIRMRQETKQWNESRNSRIHQRMSLRQPTFLSRSGGVFNGKGRTMTRKPWNKRIDQFKTKTMDFSGDISISTTSNRNTRSSNSRGDFPRMFKSIRGFRDIVPPNNQLQRPRDISSYWPDIANDKLQPIVDNGGLYQEEDFRVFRGNGHVFLPPASTTFSTTLELTKHPIQTTSKTIEVAITMGVKNIQKELTTEDLNGKHEIETFTNSAESQHRLPVHYNVLNPSTESLPDIRSKTVITRNNTKDPQELVVSFMKENTTISPIFSVEENTLPENIKKEADLRSTIDESLKGINKKKKQRIYLTIHKFPHNTTYTFLGNSITRPRRKTILTYDKLYKHLSKLTKPIPLNNISVDSDGFDEEPNLRQQNVSLESNVTSTNQSTPNVLGERKHMTNITTVFPLTSHSASGSSPFPNTTPFLVFKSLKIDNKDANQANEAFKNIATSNATTPRTKETLLTNHENLETQTSDIEKTINTSHSFESLVRSTTSSVLERQTTPRNMKISETIWNDTEQNLSAQTKEQDTVELSSVISTLGDLRSNSTKAKTNLRRLNPTTKESIVSATKVSRTKEVVISGTRPDEFVPPTIAPSVNITEQTAFTKTENAADKTGSNYTFLLSDVNDAEVSIQTRQAPEDIDLQRSNANEVKIGFRNAPKQTVYLGKDSASTLAEGSIVDLEEMSDYIEEFVHVKNASKDKNNSNHFASLKYGQNKNEKTNTTQDVLMKRREFSTRNNSFLKDSRDMFDDDLSALGSKTVMRKETTVSSTNNYGIAKSRLEKAIAPMIDIPKSSNASDYEWKEKQIIQNTTKTNSTSERPVVPKNSTDDIDLRVSSVHDATKLSGFNINDSVITRQEDETNEKSVLSTFVSLPLKKSKPFDEKHIEKEPRTSVNITKDKQPHDTFLINLSRDIKKTAKNSTKPVTTSKKLNLAMSLNKSSRKTQTSLDNREDTYISAKTNGGDKSKNSKVNISKSAPRPKTKERGNILKRLNSRKTYDNKSDSPKDSRTNDNNGNNNVTIIEPSDNVDKKENISIQNSISTKSAEKRIMNSEKSRTVERELNPNKTFFTDGPKVKPVKQNEVNKNSKSIQENGQKTRKGSVEIKSLRKNVKKDYITKNDQKEQVRKNRKLSKMMKENTIQNNGNISNAMSVQSNLSKEKDKRVNTKVTKGSANATNQHFTPNEARNSTRGNHKSVINTDRTKRKNGLKYLKTEISKNESKRIKDKKTTDVDSGMKNKLKSIQNQRRNGTKLLDNFVEIKMNQSIQLPKKKNKTPLEMLSRESKDNSSIVTDKIRVRSQKKSLQNNPGMSFPKRNASATLFNSKNKTQQFLLPSKNTGELKPENIVKSMLQNRKSTIITNTTRADVMVTDSRNASKKDHSTTTTTLSNITNKVELHGKKIQSTIPIGENQNSENDTIAVDTVMPAITPGSSSNISVKLQDKETPTYVIMDKTKHLAENQTSVRSINMEITTKTDNLIETKRQILPIQNVSLLVELPRITTPLSNTTPETTTPSLFEITQNHLIKPEVDFHLPANNSREMFKEVTLNVKVNKNTHHSDLSVTKENYQTDDLQLPTNNASKGFKDTALNFKLNKMPRQMELSVQKETMPSFHVPLGLLSTTLPSLNIGSVEVKSLLNKNEPKTVSKDSQQSKEIFHDKGVTIITKLPIRDKLTDLISPTVKPFRKSDINDTSAQIGKTSQETDLDLVPPRPFIPSTTASTASEKIIQFIGKASDLVKKMNGKKPEFLNLLTETDFNHFSGNTVQPVFQTSNVIGQQSSRANELENNHRIDKDLGKGQGISEIFKEDINKVEKSMKSSAFYSEIRKGHEEQNIFNTNYFDKSNEDRKVKVDQPFVEWITRRNNGKLNGIPPEVYTKTNETLNDKGDSFSNHSIPDILKSNLDPKSYNKSKMPLMNTLLSFRQNTASGPCNSSLGKEEIMSLAVNVLRLLVSNLKLQQALHRSHEHIVSTHFQSRRYILIPLPEDGQNRSKTILQKGYQKISQPNLSSTNSLQHQIHTFLSRNALTENLAISPLIKRRSLRKDNNHITLTSAQDGKSMDKESRHFAMKQKSPIFNKNTLTATTRDYNIQGKQILMEKKTDVNLVTENGERNQRALSKTRIKFHPSS